MNYDDEEYDDEYEEDEYEDAQPDINDYQEKLRNEPRMQTPSSKPLKTGNLLKDGLNLAKGKGKDVLGKLASMLMNAKNFVLNKYFWLIILIIFVGCLIFAMIWEAVADGTTKNVTRSVDKYIINCDTIDELARELYETRHSLLLFKISEINEIYDGFMADKANPGDIKTAMKTPMGLREVEGKEVVQYNTSTTVSVDGYDTNFKEGKDGVRDDERVKIITGSTQSIKTYMVNDKYTLKDGYISTVKVDIVDITVPVWTGSYGSQKASTVTLQVNAKLKDVIKTMYEDIYNDPSKPVINSTHCFRNEQDYPGHAFGAAVDINPDQNPMNGRYGDMDNYDPKNNKLSMDKNHPIVKIIRDKYGWDWGGDWSDDKDYMHFSFMGG